MFLDKDSNKNNNFNERYEVIETSDSKILKLENYY